MSAATTVSVGPMYSFGLEHEALRILTGELPAPSGEEIRAKQHECRMAGQERALALWSRLRWQWLVANGCVQDGVGVFRRKVSE